VQYTIRDPLAVTLYVAIGLGTILILHRYWDVPTWVSLASSWVIPCGAVGHLVGKFRGGLIGAAAGLLLGLLTIGAVGIYALVV
jgi:hypothetical protein